MKAAFVFVVCPALALGLLFGVFVPGYHPRVSVPEPTSFSCSAELASLAPLGAGGQIAPLCGQTANPEVTP